MSGSALKQSRYAIPPPHQPSTNPKTGVTNQYWYQWFTQVMTAVGDGQTSSTLALINPQNGGTGVQNDPANIITFQGAYSLKINLSANTDIAFPTSGRLITAPLTPTVAGDVAIFRTAAGDLEDGGVALDNLAVRLNPTFEGIITLGAPTGPSPMAGDINIPGRFLENGVPVGGSGSSVPAAAYASWGF